MAPSDPRDDPALDAALIARWLDGDERAASELVTRHAPAVARFVSSLGQRVDVDEVVQDTFIRAFGALQSFRADAALRTWLFTIARRLVLDRRRSERRRGTEVEVQEGDATTPGDPLSSLVAQEMHDRLNSAVARLTPMQREIFTLRVTEGMGYREIAEVVGSTEGAARVHYHHAMRSVKEFLDA